MSLMKMTGHALGWLRALPHVVAFRMCRAVIGEQRALTGASERIGAIPGMIGVYARQVFYRGVLGQVGHDVYFGYMSQFSKRDARLGECVYIGRFCSIGRAIIGSHVMLADGVQILSGAHQHGREVAVTGSLQNNAQQFTEVTIGEGAWIGAGAIIMADVGAHAIVGAGAVVTRSVPDGARVGGVPAKSLTSP